MNHTAPPPANLMPDPEACIDRPVGFAAEVLDTAAAAGIDSGVYVGCGIGSTYATLVRAGLDLVGVESSPTALTRLVERMPERRDRIVCGGLDDLPAGERYPLLVGGQAFTCGSRTAAVERLRAAQRRLAPGGLFCLRVVAAGTEVWPAHDVTGHHVDGGLSVRYRTVHAAGSEEHLFSVAELEALFAGRFTPVLPPRRSRTARRPPMHSSGMHWEVIWRRTG